MCKNRKQYGKQFDISKGHMNAKAMTFANIMAIFGNSVIYSRICIADLEYLSNEE